jgi:hypothetical protein
MRRSQRLPIVWLGLLALGLAACGDTWRGMKQDTGENLEAVGQSMENAGEDVKEDTKEPAQ